MAKATGDRPYVSAVKRLLSIPEVFTGGDLTVVFGWDSGTASNYLANWRRAGHVASLGGRSDVHMNLVRNPEVNPEKALRRAFPLATKVGADVLREAGWTTQILSSPEIAIPASGPLYSVRGFDLTGRSDKWFGRVLSGVVDPVDAARRLRPAWALADMLDRALDGRVRNAWLLAPDDIDLEAARSDPELPAALQAFGVDLEYVEDDGYGRLYDSLMAANLESWDEQGRPSERG